MGNSKKIVNKILAEAAEHKFKDKASIIVIEAGLDKDESRNYAAQIFKALRSVKNLQGKTYTLTLEIQEPEVPETPASAEEPGEKQEINEKITTNYPNIFVGWGVAGRNNGTAIIYANSAAEAKKILQAEWLDTGRVAKITTFEQYVEDAGLGYANDPEDVDNQAEELKAGGLWPNSEVGDWNELEWGS